MLLLTHSLRDSFSWSSTFSFSTRLRRPLKSKFSSPSSVIVPTETTASVAMVNPRISVGVACISQSNRPLMFAAGACLLLSSSLWLVEMGVSFWWSCNLLTNSLTHKTHVCLQRQLPSLLPTVFSAVSVYSSLCNLGEHYHTQAHFSISKYVLQVSLLHAHS